MQSVALWSDDPEFYDVILGWRELTDKIFIKVNCDVKPIIDRFGLKKIPNSEFDLYCGGRGGNRYLCVAGNDVDTEYLRDKAEKILHDHNF